jgi:uncharacterized SAM-dependent methyltransferase
MSMIVSDYILVGFDLNKEIGTLTRNYNDGSGHIMDFNLN